MNDRTVLFIGTACAIAAALTSCASTSSTPATDELAGLQSRLAMLEARTSRIEDINAIKRLQRSFGYYMDEALWDQMADLFADNGSIEMGLDGIYRGKRRVRQYLYALGDGKAGLSPGQLNEHMQLMPVITVAPDGQTARGTWRDLILAGQMGRGAFWGEGPYENEYVKENGVWKISKLHWFQTLLVPYNGGWAKHSDVNGARFVSGTLTPDAPPTITYEPWPGTFVPPFHFKNAPRTPAATTVAPQPARGSQSAHSLLRRASVLKHEIQLLHDQNSIENLQRIYGYYIDKGMWTHAADLFTENGELEIAGRGVYVGKSHVLEYLRAIGDEGPQEGRLFDNMQLQPVVHVAPDGETAKARWRLFAQVAQWKQFAEWGTGIYENQYVKEGGVWKIRRLHLFPTMFTTYEDGWGKTARARSRLEPNVAPNRPPTIEHLNYLGVFVPPFHYENPVTGKPPYAKAASSVARKLASGADVAELRSSLTDLERRVGLLEDLAEIEKLQTIYGYYLATLEWDALTELFADDGTIEIALRGVYAGKASVRRNLNLYGEQGLDHGTLHNHMQYQPVIHVAEDGTSARLRSRAFSMMGTFRKSGMWMGGVYENELVKVNSVWMFKKDQVMNTYFAPYELGWKDLVPRAPPGITDSNPPDRPPSFQFEMYPKPFLPPYHYLNPVTNKPAVVPETQPKS